MAKKILDKMVVMFKGNNRQGNASKANKKIKNSYVDTVRFIKDSGLFDEDYYLTTYPDVKALGIDPVEHYVQQGVGHGWNPNAGFDTTFYLESNPDVKEAGFNPFVHYILHGKTEGRLIRSSSLDDLQAKRRHDNTIHFIKDSGLFDEDYYLTTYPDVKESGIDPVEHYIQQGIEDGRNPNADFNTTFYLESNPDVQKANFNPFVHYILYGKAEGRLTRNSSIDDSQAKQLDRHDNTIRFIKDSGLFDEDYYLTTYPDVKESGIDPVEHYVQHGTEDGRNPNADFDTTFYLESNPDVQKAGINPFVYYILHGKAEKLTQTRLFEDFQTKQPSRHDDIVRFIKDSGLFDEDYYLTTYPDVQASGIDPVEHYVQHGTEDGRNPSADFDTGYYLEANPDVKNAGINPFVHYILNGKEEGRLTQAGLFEDEPLDQYDDTIRLIKNSGLFDEDYYLTTYTDVKVAGIDPVEHYVLYGVKDGRNPNADFDTTFYLEANPDVKNAGINPLIHYILNGKAEGRLTQAELFEDESLDQYDDTIRLIKHSGLFDEDYYLTTYTDVKVAGIDPVEHYVIYGVKDGRNPSADFDTEYYLAANPDVKNAGINPFVHYVLDGKEEGRLTQAGLFKDLQVEQLDQYDTIRLIKNSGLFDEDHYLAVYSDVKAAGIDPVEHYVKHGVEDGRNPSADFETIFYLESNTDVKEGGINPFVHYILKGKEEGRPSKDYFVNSYSYPMWLQEVESFYFKHKKPLLEKSEVEPLLEFFLVIDAHSGDFGLVEQMLVSFKKQLYTNWKLNILMLETARDESLALKKFYASQFLNDNRIAFLPCDVKKWQETINERVNNGGFDSYVGIFSKVGMLSDCALQFIASRLSNQVKILYTDHDFLDESGMRLDPNFKPDWNYDLFLSTNYIQDIVVMDVSVFNKVGGLANLGSASIYDLLLKAVDSIDFACIQHLPEIHFHYFDIDHTEEEVDIEEFDKYGKIALKNHLGDRAGVLSGLLDKSFKINWKIPFSEPKVSIIMPTKDMKDVTEVAVTSIMEKTDYTNFELVIVDNQSEKRETFEYFNEVQKKYDNVSVLKYDNPFNYSAINNYAVQYTHGEVVCLINNDIEVINDEWLTEMVKHAIREDVGCVGAKLYYSNDSIQHAGIVLGIGGVAAHGHSKYERDANGYMNRLKLTQNYTAVTAACLVVRREVYNLVGGLNEQDFKVAYNDVDFCLKVFNEGYRNIWTPYAELYHYESLSRGSDIEDEEKRERFYGEYEYMLYKWEDLLAKDPAYNLHLNKEDDQFSFTKNIEVEFDFNGKIFYEWKRNSGKLQKDVCVFVNYDKEAILHDYVMFYLKHLAKYFDIYFISTSENLHNNPQSIKKLKQVCRYIGVRKNEGYDFGSWRLGIERLQSDEIEEYESLLLCNDSVYGPIYDLGDIVSQFKNSNTDVMGLTDSNEIKYHLQSFFVLYKPKVFISEIFREFWQNIKIQKQKWQIIMKYEIGFTNKLMRLKETGYNVESYCISKDYPNLNLCHVYWDELITKQKFPFIKIELLRDNPTQRDLSGWQDLVQSVSDYDVGLIEKHLHYLKN